MEAKEYNYNIGLRSFTEDLKYTNFSPRKILFFFGILSLHKEEKKEHVDKGEKNNQIKVQRLVRKSLQT